MIEEKFRQAENKVKIEGYLAENNLKLGTYNRDGAQIEYIGGNVKVLVDQVINGIPTSVEIPVSFFVNKYNKNTGALNTAYTSLCKVKDEFISIAACGSKEEADKVRINGASVTMNAYKTLDGKNRTALQINAMFISRATGVFEPQAKGTLEFYLNNMSRVVDADGVEVEPHKMKIEAAVMKYGNKLDCIPLYADNENVISAIEQYWEPGKSYKANIRLNFTTEVQEVHEQVDFGEPITHPKTVTVREVIVTGGTQTPLTDGMEWTTEQIITANENSKLAIEAKLNKPTTNTPPQKSIYGNSGIDLGF